jgi:lysophospholipase L1-like esterase
MKFLIASIVCSVGANLAWSAEPAAPAVAPAPARIKATKIILIGDSTVAVQGGWGGSFCAAHVTSSVSCVNLGRGGRSSGSYIAEGSWDLALAEARTPAYEATWVLIQFGHNDQPGKPGRSTDLATEFPANLRRYIHEARAVGAKPVLITPLTRRMFKDGKLRNELRPWAEAAIKVAAEQNVPLVDLNASSSAAVQQMGGVEAAKFAQGRPTREVLAAVAAGGTIPAATEKDDRPPAMPVDGMAQAKAAFDYTHLGPEGAEFFSAMVAHELARQVPELRPLLLP